MTPDLDAIRDRVAEWKGWKVVQLTPRKTSWYRGAERWEDAPDLIHTHPYPASLDGAASALPEGWEWKRMNTLDGRLTWFASKWGDYGIREASVSIPDTGNEIHDRFALALAALESGTLKGKSAGEGAQPETT